MVPKTNSRTATLLAAGRRAGVISTLVAALGLVLAFAAPAAALEQKLSAADGTARDAFGASVAIDGDTAVVGAYASDASRGAVYVFARIGDSWTKTAKLTASDGAAGDQFGYSVAIDGDTIVAGAPRDLIATAVDQGSVYTFSRSGAAQRSETAKLTASGGGTGDRLGYSVAIDGDTIVAGAPFDALGANANQGSVYTFARSGAAVRSQTAKLTAAGGAADDHLGMSVAIGGDTIVAGAPSRSIGGAVFTFARTGAAERSHTAELTASTTSGGLGDSVAVSGDAIVAGAPFDRVGPSTNQGSAYVFARSGASERTETARLISADGGDDDLVGVSVAIDGTQLIAGAPRESFGGQADPGYAVVFFTPAAAPPVVPVVVPDPPVVPPKPVVPALPARPSISGFGFSPRKIAVGRKATAVAAVARGGRFTYTLNTAARVTIVIERKLRGRRQGRRCVSPKKRLKRKCTRYKRSGTLTRTGKAGKNTTAFSGRIGSRALARGSYRATIRATNASGTSTRRTTTFKVVRGGKRRARSRGA